MAAHRLDLGEALARARDPLTDVRDRALATDLVTGTLRWRDAIDYQLGRISTKPLHRLDDAVLDALRLGAYQLLHLDRVPVSAVVNDTVAIVKASGFRSAAGFVNAILRRLARERDQLTWPLRPATVDSDVDRRALIEHLAVVHSHPRWLVERWAERYGLQGVEEWLAFNNRPPAMTVAANRIQGTRTALQHRLAGEGIDTVPTPIASHGLVVRSGRVLASAAFQAGACLVQDEASQTIAELVAAADGHRVLDACASPGGKTVAIAAQVAPSGMVVACDVRPRRIRLLAETLRRSGVGHAAVVHVSPDGEWPFAPETFDRVLVDAPCSGLGTVRREPDIRWRRTAADLDVLARAQHDLLMRVAPLVTPGGRLVYSTCSSEPEENEHVVARFLAAAPAFAVVPLSAIEGLPGRLAAMSTPEGYLQTTPHEGLEAFFGAVLRKRLVAL
jgi:16S rRNA (cytosine967-C5)-methyltransferase